LKSVFSKNTNQSAQAILIKNIKEGNTAELLFYLKTQGKSRGYVERQETTGADGEPLINFTRQIIDDVN
jgi:hypothetical protein